MTKKVTPGRIVQIIGTVIDVYFPNHLPKQNELLVVDAGDRKVKIEVLAHNNDNTVRCISMEATEGLSRGMSVTATRDTIKVPVGAETLGRVVNALGEPIDGKGEIKGPKWSIYREAPSLTEQSPSRTKSCLLKRGTSLHRLTVHIANSPMSR